MKVTVWKNDKESMERCITRFNKKVQGSRKLLKLKGERYFSKSPTKRYVRQAAIMREQYRAKNERTKFY